MGTKIKPTPNDAWDKAEADEPRFALLARDVLAPGCVRLWAALRAHDQNRAKDIFANLLVTSTKMPYAPGKDPSHIIEARECSNHMELWRREKNPRAMNARSVVIDETDGSDGTGPAGEMPVAHAPFMQDIPPRRPEVSRTFLYKGHGEMIPFPDHHYESWPKVTLENRTGAHSEAIERWAVIEHAPEHQFNSLTIFEDKNAKQRAEQYYKSLLDHLGFMPP